MEDRTSGENPDKKGLIGGKGLCPVAVGWAGSGPKVLLYKAGTGWSLAASQSVPTVVPITSICGPRSASPQPLGCSRFLSAAQSVPAASPAAPDAPRPAPYTSPPGQLPTEPVPPVAAWVRALTYQKPGFQHHCNPKRTRHISMGVFCFSLLFCDSNK